MKFAFSTLACPAWSIEQSAEAAISLGYDGIELRLLDGEVIDPATDAGRLDRAVAVCRARGVEVCALGTSCRLNQADQGERHRQVDELLRWIRLAGGLEAPVVRVFGGEPESEPASSEDEANAWVAESLNQVASEAERSGVTVALETHDAFASARRVAAVLERVPSPRIGALWDSFHPFRFGESASVVIAAVGRRLVHVHVKDARRLPDHDSSAWELVLLGEGEVPVGEQLRTLRRSGYTGYASVEWEKKWHSELAEPEVALPQHLRWLRRLDIE